MKFSLPGATVTNAPESPTPPYSTEAEQSVLGGLMLDNSAWINIADCLTENDFFLRKHQHIFHAIKTLSEEGHPCDLVTLAGWLARREELDATGGLEYLNLLYRNIPSVANIIAYANIVRECSIMRQLVQVGNSVISSVYHNQGMSSKELVDNAERLVFEIAERGERGQGGFLEIKDILPVTLDRIDALFQKGSAITGISTGFRDFDEQTSGLQRSDLIIVAGRPSMGKTAFSINMAAHVAIKDKLPVAVFSMEMPSEQLAMRLISSEGGIDLQKVRSGRLDDEDWPRITSAITLLSQAPLFIDDKPALSPTELRARARRLTREQGQLGLVIIDYIQLMQVPDTRESRAVEVSEISRSLKSLAKELNVPILALSQLNRSLEQRPDKRPKMSDLRESGSLEQDADLIVFIYRDEVYHEDSPDKGTAEIIIAKQRNGPTGKLRLTFRANLTRFENHADSTYYQGN